MMLLPGWSGFKDISDNPEIGPLFIQRISFAILVREEAYLVKAELKVRTWFCELIISPFTNKGLNLILSSL